MNAKDNETEALRRRVEPELRRATRGATIAQLRERRMTQGELAERIGVTQATVSRIEHGKLDPDMTQVQAIASALQMPAATLVHHFDVAYDKALEQVHAATGRTGKDEDWKTLAAIGVIGLVSLAGFAAALALLQDGDEGAPVEPSTERRIVGGGEE